MSLYFDRQGQPMSLAEWRADMETADRTVAKTEVGSFLVSTVWLGLNHGFGGGPPIIFETMVFEAERGGDGLRECLDWQERYSTEAEALEGHARAVAWVEAGCPKEVEDAEG